MKMFIEKPSRTSHISRHGRRGVHLGAGCVIAFLVIVSFSASGGELADYDFTLKRDNQNDLHKSRSQEEINSTNHGISEIGIERGPCFGPCPIYTFIVRSDGSFRYKGDENVKRKGEFTGTVPARYFHQLAQFIRDSDYMELENVYFIGVTDCATTYTMVVMNGKRKVVRNYADAGPTRLWAIEQVIDGLMSKATWDEPNKAPTK